MRLAGAEAAEACDIVLHEPHELISRTEFDIRSMMHDLLNGHHDRDYRCRAAFLLEWFNRVVLAFMRISYDGDVQVERVIGSQVQPDDVERTAHWWMTIHRGHARAVFFSKKETVRILSDLRDMGRPPMDLFSSGWDHMINASQDSREEPSVPSADLEKCQFCVEHKHKHRRRAGAAIVSGARGWGLQSLLAACAVQTASTFVVQDPRAGNVADVWARAWPSPVSSWAPMDLDHNLGDPLFPARPGPSDSYQKVFAAAAALPPQT